MSTTQLYTTKPGDIWISPRLSSGQIVIILTDGYYINMERYGDSKIKLKISIELHMSKQPLTTIYPEYITNPEPCIPNFIKLI